MGSPKPWLLRHPSTLQKGEVDADAGEVLEIKKTLVDATEPFNHKRDKAACFLRVFQYLCPHAAPRFNTRNDNVSEEER